MAKSIKSFLPEYEPETQLVQAKIGIELVRKATRIKEQRQLQWQEVLTALLEKFCEDLGPKDDPRLVK